MDLAKSIPDYLFQVITGAELGLCYLRQGNVQAVQAELENCQQIAVEQQVLEPYSRVVMLNNLAEAYLFAFEYSNTPEKAA